MSASSHSVMKSAARRALVLLAIGVLARPLCAAPLNDSVQPHRLTLDNGLEVWLKPQPAARTLTLMAGVKVGHRYERLDQRGLAHFVEHMLFQGTSRRTHQELEDGLALRGGKNWGTVHDDFTLIGMSLPAQEMQFGLEWLCEMLFDSAFRADRLEVTRRVVLREQQPQSYATLWWRVTRAVWGDNSLVEGPKDHKRGLRNVKRFRRQDLVRFYQEQYRPNNTVVAVVGDFDLEQAQAAVRRVFGAVSRGARPSPGARADLTLPSKPARAAGFSYYKSAYIWCGHVASAADAEDWSRLAGLCWLAAKRAVDLLRETEGKTYAIRPYPVHPIHPPQEATLAMLSADCHYRDIAHVERALRAEFARLRQEPPSASEVAMVREAAASAWRDWAEGSTSLASVYVHWASRLGDFPDVEAMIDAITADGLQQAARRHFQPSRLVVGYYRPYKTPWELAALGGVLLATLGGLLVVGRRRSARLRTPGERLEETVTTRNTRRLLAAKTAQGLVWGIVGAFLLYWPAWKVSEYLFTRAMFAADLAFLLAYGGLLFAFLSIGVAWSVARRILVTGDGAALITPAFHRFLAAHRVKGIEVGGLNPWRLALDPRVSVVGGDCEQWVILRGPRGITWYLGVGDAEAFAAQARALLWPQPAAAPEDSAKLTEQ